MEHMGRLFAIAYAVVAGSIFGEAPDRPTAVPAKKPVVKAAQPVRQTPTVEQVPDAVMRQMERAWRGFRLVRGDAGQVILVRIIPQA